MDSALGHMLEKCTYASDALLQTRSHRLAQTHASTHLNRDGLGPRQCQARARCTAPLLFTHKAHKCSCETWPRDTHVNPSSTPPGGLISQAAKWLGLEECVGADESAFSPEMRVGTRNIYSSVFPRSLPSFEHDVASKWSRAGDRGELGQA